MTFAPRTPFDWKLRTRSLALGQQTRIMGILNVTPDSFSDGGRHLSLEAAVRHGLALLDEGADILDLGGESTRPSATPVTPEEEQARVLPVLTAILKARPEAILSIDTFHAGTARLALEAGAEIVNDVSGFLWDAAMPPVCAALGCGVVLMHTRGRPDEWEKLPSLPPVAVMPVVLTGLRDSILRARKAGVPSDNLVLDPGFGFGKRGVENYTIHALLSQMHQFGLPLLTGSSRKRFLRHADAQTASLASEVASILAGAHIVRVHEVRAAIEAAGVADAILAAAAGIGDATAGFAKNTSTVPQ
jgi:dihydropteroate synthase